MNLAKAPLNTTLRIAKIDAGSEDESLVLRQMGIYVGERVEKLHVAPLGDPLTLRVGGQRFSLRMEISKRILVEAE